MIELAVLIMLTGPDRQAIYLNPAAVVSVRKPRSNEHLGKGVHCIIHTDDGKFVSVADACSTVRDLINK